MDFKGTKGNWLESENKVFSTNGNAICSVYDNQDTTDEYKPMDEQEVKANAKLIAAAPELLETLKLCSKMLSLNKSKSYAEIKVHEEVLRVMNKALKQSSLAID